MSDFFVGYLPTPGPVGRRMKRVAFVLVGVLALAAAVLAAATGPFDRRPGPRGLGGTEQHQRRFERQRRERLAREADRSTVVHGGDDGDAGAELPEDVPEPARVDARAGFGFAAGHYLNPTEKS